MNNEERARAAIGCIESFLQYPYRDQDRGCPRNVLIAIGLLTEIERNLEVKEEEAA